MEKMVKNYKSKETEAPADQLDFGLKVVIDQVVYQKVMHWVNKSDYEVSGLGNVVFEPETNTLRVIDAIMLPQKNTGTTTDIEGADVAKAMFQLRNSPGTLRWWWHSHVNMGVFWSGTDISTIKTLGNGGWFCATVFNKRNETKSAFCQKTPVRLLVPDIPTQLASASRELTAAWDAEYEKNVENIQHSFRESYIQRLREAEDDEEGTQKAKEASSQEDEEWETIRQEGYTFRRKKNNIVPVQRKSLNEKTLADLAGEDELDKYEARDENTKEELDQEVESLGELSDEDRLAVDEFLKSRGHD